MAGEAKGRRFGQVINRTRCTERSGDTGVAKALPDLANVVLKRAVPKM